MQLFLTFPYYNPNQFVPDSSNSFHISFHHLSVESRALSAAWWHLGPPCTSQGTQLSYIFGAEGKAGRYPFSSLGHPAGYASTPEVEDWWHFSGLKNSRPKAQPKFKDKKKKLEANLGLFFQVSKSQAANKRAKSLQRWGSWERLQLSQRCGNCSREAT